MVCSDGFPGNTPVIEEQPVLIPGRDGEMTEIPVDMSKPNPNGSENDCLYLDMNGIVHPCTHPEGKPAPKTEEDMMVEVFKYTERVVNMARPRKVLLMAIDGVAPRAKMNQQRSRRFRSAEEAKTKAKEKEEAIKEWEAMGKTLTDEYKNEKAWDSNAITPGTPFMDLLASSLRYWVVYKMNTDPGWAGLQVIISDASVPGEGEHKIMDFVRRQRAQPGYDPNTSHVFYGLDADLIMLSLATHEPNFKILREDVFAQGAKRGCHKCGQPGHHSSNCLGIPPEKKEAEASTKSSALKPFIFLDVSTLREYLQVELNVPGLGFPFDVERAIDDWVFMIFFVGNDFLPHLPSLDIREGAIDMLLKIWRNALPQMGGYLTDNGKVDLPRAQFIMDGLSEREDDIFRKRRETEQRQEAVDQEKRRRIERQTQGQSENTVSMRNGVDYVPVLSRSTAPTAVADTAQSSPPGPSLPEKPSVVIPPANPLGSNGLNPKSKTPMFLNSARPRGDASIRGGFVRSGSGTQAVAATTSNGNDVSPLMASGQDVVANRAAIRKANLSAAEMLKAELMASMSSQNGSSDHQEKTGACLSSVAQNTFEEEAKVNGDESSEKLSAVNATDLPQATAGDAIVDSVPPAVTIEQDGTKDAILTEPLAAAEDIEEDVSPDVVKGGGLASDATPLFNDDSMMNECDSFNKEGQTRGIKRSADEAGVPADRAEAEMFDSEGEMKGAPAPMPSTLNSEEEDNEDEDDEDEDEDEEDDDDDMDGAATALKPHVPKPLKMLGNNMVEQEDTVKLWEPGYKERYYEQKFGVRIDDVEFRRGCAKAYVEGLSWVLAYYYNGCPSWTWYYPYHFAPFASDFTDLANMQIKFEKGAPFKPFEQLMGVFPAASRSHIPEAFQGLMIDKESEIIDFYPEEFSIDMNGKKMLWQGVALLPFIDQDRLLSALAKRYPNLTEDEVRRNTFGEDVIFVNEDNPLYNQICSLYMKRKVEAPVTIDASLSKGVRGTILPDQSCVPNSTYISPLTDQNLSDIESDRSISAFWFMPPQSVQHRSVLLPGYKPKRRVLTPEDIDGIHRGLNGEERRYRQGPAGDGFHAQRRQYDNGPGVVRRDARNVYDNRRTSGNYGRSSYDDRRDSYRGGPPGPGPGPNAYGASGGSRDNGPYSGYSTPNSGYNTPSYSQSQSQSHSQSYSQSYGGGSSYGGRGGHGGSTNGRAPEGSGYGGYGGNGGYGGSGGGGYGGYGTAPSPSNYGGGYAPPNGPRYGSSSTSYGGGYQPTQPQAPQAPSQQYGGYGGYGGYGSYGQASSVPNSQQQQQQQQQPGYGHPQPGYNNRGAILPAHLRGNQPNSNFSRPGWR